MTRASSFWDRRRAAVRAEAEAETLALREAEDAAEQQALAEKTDAEILAELDLPDPDSLQMGDDFTRFMMRKVPQHIRQRALRRLWRSNPVLACVDGLNDYDDDYLTGSYGNAPVKTTYQVGKGLMAHLLEMERQASIDSDEAPEADLTEAPETETTGALAALSEDQRSATLDTPADSLKDASDVAPTLAMDTGTAAELETTEEAAPLPKAARRMTFHFDGDTA